MEKQTQFELGIVALGAVAAMLLALGMIHDSTYIVAYAQQISSSSTPLTQSNNSSSINNVTHTLSVTGTASSKVKPDKVILTLGVQTTNKTANAALATNSVTMNKVLDVLKKDGVKDNETSTSSFTISPNYNYSQSSGGTGRITGFTVFNSIQIETSNIKNITKWIDASVAAGANTINNIDFSLTDKKLEQTKNSLIKQAIDNARTKADIAASASGLRITHVKSLNLNDFEIHPPSQPFLAKGALAAGGAAAATNNATPVISGEEQVSLSVSIIFLIG